jgi:hypothetical protein
MSGFGGFGGFGGDFADSQDAQEATPSRSQRTPGGGRQSQAGPRQQVKQRCVPTSVKSLLTGEENLYGLAPAAYVTIVAQVVGDFSFEAGGLAGKVSDGTGVVLVKQFAENSAAVDHSAVKAGAWLKIVGTMRPGNDPYLSVAFLVPVSNLNELAYHIVSTCSAYADLQEELGGGIRSLTFPEVSTPQMPASFPNTSTPNAKRVHVAQVNIKDEIVNFLSQGSTLQWGFSRGELEDKMKMYAGPSELSKILEELKDDGLIYDTKDENHFKANK